TPPPTAGRTASPGWTPSGGPAPGSDRAPSQRRGDEPPSQRRGNEPPSQRRGDQAHGARCARPLAGSSGAAVGLPVGARVSRCPNGPLLGSEWRVRPVALPPRLKREPV